MATLPKPYIAPEEYLRIERKSEIRHEYFRGEMFAMTGASDAHNAIAGNLFASLHAQFRKRKCRAYVNDMRVRVDDTGLYTYPDVAAVCGERELADEHLDTLLNPALIVEVLSESTEIYDRGKKFDHYRQIPSLRQYVLVSQTAAQVEIFTRTPENNWLLSVVKGLDAEVELSSVQCRVAMADLYENVDLPGV